MITFGVLDEHLETINEVTMTEIRYTSTRDANIEISASQAIIKGLSDDGGLFVPTQFPRLDTSLEEFADLDYRETAYRVMKLFLSDFTEEELRTCINNAYDSKFDTPEIAPLMEAGGSYFLELFHGRTIAFKDMALSILPHLLITAAKKNDVKEEIVILTATSGDTGKAALAGFAGVKGTRIIVFFPKDGVSPVQKKQMVTQKGDNTFVVGVDGNFDDCQTGVKNIFNNKELTDRLIQKGFRFSSANSINIGRLIPQVVYYVYAYSRLVKSGSIKPGEKIDFCVPTGNFGNILAGYYAKLIGLPVNKLICASNENKVLYDFFESGVYDRNRKFILTSSPSMDILISSNLERLIYHIAGDNAGANSRYMQELSQEGKYAIEDDMRGRLVDFVGFYADEAETAGKIRSLYEESGYIIDTHTAVAAASYDKYRQSYNPKVPAVIVSTASPYKFSRSVMTAIDKSNEAKGDFELIDEMSALSGVGIPDAIEEIRNAEIRHKTECRVDEMQAVAEGFLEKC